MSSSTKSIRRAIWEGSIPIRIMLDPSESKVFDQSDFYNIHMPRTSYLPIFIPQIYDFFSAFLLDPTISTPQNAWFEVENSPLKWHWPIGLLYDFYTALDPSKDASPLTPKTTTHPNLPRVNEDDEDAPTDNDDDPDPGTAKLPWILTLRFRDYPSEHLMSLHHPRTCHDAFINAVKEADFARNGNAKASMGLSKADSASLWQSIETREFEQFWSVNDKLLGGGGGGNGATSGGGGGGTGVGMRNVPMRIYNPETGQVIQASVPSRQVNTPRGDPHTLGTALHLTVPGLFPSRSYAILAKPVMHGIILPMNAPLAELTRDVMYPDGFLHITLAMI